MTGLGAGGSGGTGSRGPIRTVATIGGIVAVTLSLPALTAVAAPFGAAQRVEVTAADGTDYDAFVRSGSTWTEQAKLIAPDGAAYDAFGGSVAVRGNTAVVGASGDAVGTPPERIYGAGSAYVFVRSGSTWTLQTKLLAPDLASNDYFGYSVAMDGNTVLVGAVGDDAPQGSNAGSAYVFVRSGTTWTEQAVLNASDATAGAFGWAVDISGNIAVVG